MHSTDQQTTRTSQHARAEQAAQSGTRHTMQAAVLTGYGGPERFELRQIPRPRINEDQVLVRVHAAGINPIDWRIRNGQLRWLLPLRFPAVLGYDIAGEIVAVGTRAAASGWKLGQAVCCFSDDQPGGGYAEYAAVASDCLARKPANVSFEEAAAIPLAAITAWRVLRDIAPVTAGDPVLINGASGGVGTFAVQIATAYGGDVTGVCSGSNTDLVKKLGAVDTIDYTQRDFTELNQKLRLVFDAVGKSSYPACRKLLTSRGAYVSTLPSASSVFFGLATLLMGKRCRMVLARPDGDQLHAICRLVESGHIRPIVDEVFSLDDVAAAHAKSEAGHSVGKLILRMN